jgi:hypothetical protein
MKFIGKFLFIVLFASSVLSISYWYKLNTPQQQALLRDANLAWQNKRLPDNFWRNLSQQSKSIVENIRVDSLETTINNLGSAIRETHTISCQRTATEEVQALTQSTVYSWVDEKGRKHYSDQKPPENFDHSSQNFDAGLDYFNLSIDDSKADKVAFSKDKIRVDVSQIYKVLAQQMPRTQLRKVSLNLRLFKQQDEFQDYKNSIAPGLNTNSGFYTSALNEAVVFQHRNNTQQTFAVIRHESSHVIMAGLFGATPIWFNEGFAEYFERLAVAGQQRKVALADEHLALLRQQAKAAQLPDLSDFFAYSGEAFYSEDTVMRNYALGWSMVFFLQSNTEGKRLFASMIKQLSAKPCVALDMPYLAGNNYPGGIAGLAQDWQRWLLHADISAHYY